MDMEFTVKADNTDLIKAASRRARKVALEAVASQAERNGKIEVTRAVYDTPERGYKRTGDLRKFIKHGVEGNDTAWVGIRLDYAPYVEYGTIHMPARPFIKPAVQNHMDEYKQIIQEHMKNA